MLATDLLGGFAAAVLPDDLEHVVPRSRGSIFRENRLHSLAHELGHGHTAIGGQLLEPAVLLGIELHLSAYHDIMLFFHAIMISWSGFLRKSRLELTRQPVAPMMIARFGP